MAADLAELQRQFTKLMDIMKKERKLHINAEAKLAASQTAAAAIVNPAPVVFRGLKISIPDQYNVTRGEKAEQYVCQVTSSPFPNSINPNLLSLS
ncbi:hypothetical protein PSTT_00293 [Puccinia striiformis]|uniref:Uncharacterized protein n=1 Tax=Puccinia striiformis TaxID=27350 RepID=A0A2S4W7E8_9BASI|nr:hypothetical protein PSTT_00293 [Puccinia striiformis]